MRVRVAYISSLGTTAILVAAALTLLTVVGAIVAFKGWPGSAEGSGVQSVPLAPASPPSRAALVRHTAVAHHVVRKAPAHASRRGSTAGLVKAAGAGKQIAPGLIMVPAHAAPPMAAHPLGGAPTPHYPAPVSTPTATPRDVPSGGPGPVPDTGTGLSLPALDPSAPPPPDPVTTLAGGLLSGGPPPPMHLHLHLR
jgi:hypothetical protein